MRQSGNPLQRVGGDALVDHVDRAANGLAAVKKHGRPAQDLDALGRQRIDRYRVVVGRVRYVERCESVDEDLHTLAGEPAYDRTRRAGREAGGRNTRQVRQHFAKLSVEVSLQVDALDHIRARQHIQLGQTFDGDDDLAVRADIPVVQVVIRIFLRRGRRRTRSLCECGHRTKGQRGHGNGM